MKQTFEPGFWKITIWSSIQIKGNTNSKGEASYSKIISMNFEYSFNVVVVVVISSFFFHSFHHSFRIGQVIIAICIGLSSMSIIKYKYYSLQHAFMNHVNTLENARWCAWVGYGLWMLNYRNVWISSLCCGKWFKVYVSFIFLNPFNWYFEYVCVYYWIIRVWIGFYWMKTVKNSIFRSMNQMFNKNEKELVVVATYIMHVSIFTVIRWQWWR